MCICREQFFLRELVLGEGFVGSDEKRLVRGRRGGVTESGAGVALESFVNLRGE